MSEARPSLEEWRRLYEAAIRLKQIAPWEWMEETDVFGVQDPETQELGFVSIMGLLGQHLALGLYLGAEGLYRFWGIQAEPGEMASLEAMLAVRELQVSFEDRDMLDPEDRAVIKELGLTFRGRQAWPLFRSYRPGYFPWFLEPAEARFLTHAIEQAIDVVLRYRDNPDLLQQPGEYDYLVRVPHQEGTALVWEDRIVTVPPVEPELVAVPMDMLALETARKLPRMSQALEVDFFVMPIRVGTPGERPRYPYMLLLVETSLGLVCGHQLFEVQTSIEATWGLVPLGLVREFLQMKMLPRRVRVMSPYLPIVLKPLSEELGFDIELARELPALQKAKDSLFETFT
jgi:hypothetical protein